MGMDKHSLKQQGFVSIIVAAVLMILLSLVTIGFTKLMQREQRQALDRQLSTQAFYAAETAVNDVRSKVQLGTLPVGEEKVGCSVSGPVWNGGVVDPSVPEVTYTCLEYDTTPIELVFTDTIIASSSKVFPIETKTESNIITFEWSGPNGSVALNNNPVNTTCPSSLPASFTGGTIPMLRIDLIKTPAGGSGVNITRQDLIDNTATVYLYPMRCGTTTGVFTDYVGANSGRVIDVNCPVDGSCVFNMDTPADTNRYFARVKSVYGDVGTLKVGATDILNNRLEFLNAQVLVDATGRANDVLRRIEVRLSSSPDYDWPEAVIESSNGLCKLLEVAPDATNPTIGRSNCYN